MLLAMLCLVAMVEYQSSQHISKMWQHRHTKVMISNNRINWAPVSGNYDSFLSAPHRTRLISHFVRDSMRHSGNANRQTVRNVWRCKLILNGFSPVLFLSPWYIGGSFPKDPSAIYRTSFLISSLLVNSYVVENTLQNSNFFYDIET